MKRTPPTIPDHFGGKEKRRLPLGLVKPVVGTSSVRKVTKKTTPPSKAELQKKRVDDILSLLEKKCCTKEDEPELPKIKKKAYKSAVASVETNMLNQLPPQTTQSLPKQPSYRPATFPASNWQTHPQQTGQTGYGAFASYSTPFQKRPFLNQPQTVGTISRSPAKQQTPFPAQQYSPYAALMNSYHHQPKEGKKTPQQQKASSTFNSQDEDDSFLIKVEDDEEEETCVNIRQKPEPQPPRAQARTSNRNTVMTSRPYKQSPLIESQQNNKHRMNTSRYQSETMGQPSGKYKDKFFDDFYTGPNSPKEDFQLFEDIPVMDKKDDKGYIVGTSQSLEKSYFRLKGEPHSSDIRPIDVLKKALKYVLDKFNTNKDYHYICDQLKGIRQDLTLQHIEDEFSIRVYEIHSRISLENVC